MQVGIGSTFFKENNTNKYLGKDNKTYSHHLVIVNKKLDFFMSNIGFVQKRKNNKFLQTKRKKINVKHIVKKEIIKTHNEEVYDLSVEDTHRFYGNNILLKNTDSIFIKADKEFKNLDEKKKFGKELEAELNKFFNEWVAKEFGTKSYLTIELEKIYSHFFIATKKRYVGYNELSGETIFVGMEAIRGDWTPLAQKFQREIVSLIFADKEKTEIEEFVSSYVDKLKKGELDDLLIYSKKITKPLNQYTKMTPPHVRAARELGDNFSGRTVRYVLTLDGPKHVKLTDENVKYDYEHYIDKQLKGVSDDLLNTLGVDFEKIVFGKKQSSLDKFF